MVIFNGHTITTIQLVLSIRVMERSIIDQQACQFLARLFRSLVMLAGAQKFHGHEQAGSGQGHGRT